MSAKQSENSCIYKDITALIGQSFKKYRENSGLSMREIYKQEKISIAVMSDMESGKKLPRAETLIRLMEKVNMPLTEVFAEKLFKETPKHLREEDRTSFIKCIYKDSGFPDKAIKEALEHDEFLKFKYSKYIEPTCFYK